MAAAEVLAGSARIGTGVVQMRRSLIGLALVAIGLTGLLRPAAQPDFSGIAARGTATPAPAAVTGNNEQKVLDGYGKLPLAFVPNAGQTDSRVRYSAQAGGATFYFTPNEAVFAFGERSSRQARGVVLRLAFLGANPGTRIEGQGLQTGKVNYLIGSDPASWRTGLPTYGQVVYRDLWPGVDMVFRGDAGRLKYEFVLRPGAKAADISLAYRGAKALSVAQAGHLLIRTPAGTLKDVRPVSYQEVGGRRVPVESRFVLQPDASHTTAYGFAVGAYDAGRPLVIDPGLLYSTYLGGNNSDIGARITVDASGNAYVTGETESTNFPTTAGAFDMTSNGNLDVFVTKLNSTGSALVYSTYLGGSADDRGFAIAIDALGSAYITGETNSNNFPVTGGAFDTSYNTNGDAFVTRLNPAGSAPLMYSTYLGGSSRDEGNGIALDGSGSAYVTGETNSNTFPITGGAFDTSYNGQGDAFVTKLNPVGSAPLLYSTYLGGAQTDIGADIAVAAGSAHVTGRTNSNTFPITPGAFDTGHNGGDDAFVTKLNPAGSAPLVYSTFLGGSNIDRGFDLALDGASNAFVAGETNSNNFPTTATAFDTGSNGNLDAFVTKLNAAGSAPLFYSTYLGGSAVDGARGIAVDGVGSAYVTGLTASNNFPTTAGAFDTVRNSDDAFVTKLNAAGSAPLSYSTFLGGTSADEGHGIAVDAPDSVYVTGETNSSNFPTAPNPGAFDTTYNTDGDAFVTKLHTSAGVPATLTLEPPADTNPIGTPHTVTATVTDSGGNPVSGVTVRFSVTGAHTTSGSDTTDVNGEATFTYTGTTVGPDAIHAFADTNNDGDQDLGEPFGDAAKTWTPMAPGPPATLTLEPAADTNTAGTEHCVTATVRDALGTPVPGVTVRFSVTGANSASGVDTTDASGKAEFCYTGTAAGLDAIHAFADTNNDGDQDATEPFGDAAKTWGPAAPATLTLDPPADTNTVGTPHTVTATVRDAFANPVPGVTVRFSVTGANSASGSDTTDANGEANFTYTGTTTGLDAIHAFADTNNDGDQDATEPFGDAAKTWTPGAPATLTLEPLADENTAGEEHCVTATVRDAFGNPVPGVTVRFSVTGANTASGSETTNGSGQAEFCYTGQTAGEDAITAFADTNDDGDQDLGEPAGAATKTWTPGAPATVTVEPAADTNTAGEEHCVTATVRDAFGNRVPGVTVRFSVTGANSASGSDTTDANGEATFCYTGTTAGQDAITAFADTNDDGDQDLGEPAGAATKTWTPGAPATLTLEPAADTNSVGEEHCVTATVRDAFGNRVPGVRVRFSVTPATFPSPSSGSDVTDANGEATFCYTAALPGEDVITAFADTNDDGDQDLGEPAGVATKTWTPPPSTEFCEVKITEGGWIIAINGDRASFGGNAKVDADGNVQGQQQYQDHGPADPRNVHSIELLATTCSDDLTTATIFGTATKNGSGMFFFRIDVIDNGEPGTDDSYGIMMSDLYVSGQKQLQGGNVQIHKN
jgi:protocatechuate 3,4-dioxygenase beta subunit